MLRKQRQPDETAQPDGNQLVDFVAEQIAVSFKYSYIVNHVTTEFFYKTD